MAGIDNLTDRIIKDAKGETVKIENEAKEAAAKILDESDKKAQAMIAERKDKAVKDGLDRYDRIISKAELDSRNALISAKQEVIDKVFGMALQKIDNMDSSEYCLFLEGMLLNNVESGDEEVIFSAKGKDRIAPGLLDNVNQKLASQNRKGMLKMGEESDSIASGFILKKGGVEINCTVESRLKMLRDGLEGEIASILFEDR